MAVSRCDPAPCATVPHPLLLERSDTIDAVARVAQLHHHLRAPNLARLMCCSAATRSRICVAARSAAPAVSKRMVRSTAGFSFAGYGEAIIDDNAQGKGVLWLLGAAANSNARVKRAAFAISTHVNVN